MGSSLTPQITQQSQVVGSNLVAAIPSQQTQVMINTESSNEVITSDLVNPTDIGKSNF